MCGCRVVRSQNQHIVLSDVCAAFLLISTPFSVFFTSMSLSIDGEPARCVLIERVRRWQGARLSRA